MVLYCYCFHQICICEGLHDHATLDVVIVIVTICLYYSGLVIVWAILARVNSLLIAVHFL